MFRTLKMATYKEIIWLIVSMLFITVSIATDLIQPWLFSEANQILMTSVKNTIKSSNDSIMDAMSSAFPSIGYTVAIMAGISLGGVLFNLTSIFISISICTSITTRIRIISYSNIQYLSIQDIDKFSMSSLITRVNSDIYQVQQMLIMIFNMLIKTPFYLIGGFGLSLWQTLSLTLSHGIEGANNIAIAYAIIPVMLIIVFFMIKTSKPYFIKSRQTFDQNNKIMIENLNGSRVVRAFNLQDNQIQRFDDTSTNLKKYNIKGEVIMSAMMPVMTLLINIALDLVIVFGGYAASNITNVADYENVAILLTTATAFIQYFFIIVMGFMFFAMVMNNYSKAKISATRVFEVIDSKTSITSKPGAVKFEKGDIEFKNVTFKYNKEGESPVLDNISFKLKEGQSLGIIGQTGSGKSTLVNLIPRLYDVQEGEVIVSNNNVKDLDLDSLKANISVAFQEKILFKGTVKSNIKVAKKDATDKEIIEALKMAEAYDFVKEKDGEIDCVVEQKGKNFSGGQKQRISIARALIGKPKILIFDDSTSALDNITEKKLLSNIKKNLKGTTLIMVAQRVKSIQDLDNIIVLDNGKIIGQGTHKELLKKCSAYKKIYDSQNTEVGE